MKTLAILVIAIFGLANGRSLLDEEFPHARLFPLMEDDYQEKRAALAVDPSVLDFYNDMLSTQNKYAILKINDNNKVVIDSQGQSKDTTIEEEDEVEFNKMKNALLALKEPRYILYKFSFFSQARQMIVKKVVFVIWANSEAKNSELLDYKNGRRKVMEELGLNYSITFSTLRSFTYPKMVQRVQYT